jgi:uncharacterized protein YcfL
MSITLAACALLLLVAGCASVPQVDSRVTVTPDAQSWVRVIDVVDGTANDGAPTADVVIESTSSRVRHLRWRITWSDDGHPYKSILAEWQTFTLPPYDSRVRSQTAPNANMDDFTVVIDRVP